MQNWDFSVQRSHVDTVVRIIVPVPDTRAVPLADSQGNRSVGTFSLFIWNRPKLVLSPYKKSKFSFFFLASDYIFIRFNSTWF